jgi:hypothetical protein
MIDTARCPEVPCCSSRTITPVRGTGELTINPSGCEVEVFPLWNLRTADIGLVTTIGSRRTSVSSAVPCFMVKAPGTDHSTEKDRRAS